MGNSSVDLDVDPNTGAIEIRISRSPPARHRTQVRSTLGAGMAERDLFANFDRMRREMDELFGGVFERSGLSRRHTGHWPAVDVAYVSDPPRAIVTAELAGMEVDDIALQIEGRKLFLAGRRGTADPAGEVYQQIEIERGSFRRLIELVADVDPDHVSARYEDGMLRVELPLVGSPERRRPVPIESGDPQ
jgi:HSP20 family protein